LKGKDGSRPTAHAMVKELSQAREDHLNNFLSNDNPQPHCTAWGAQDLSKDSDDTNSEDTWSNDSEEQTCTCFKTPQAHWKRNQPSTNQEEDEMNTRLVDSDELSREHESVES